MLELKHFTIRRKFFKIFGYPSEPRKSRVYAR